MIIDNCYVVTPENAEEVKLANDAILKYREQCLRNEQIKKCKLAISDEISIAIRRIGLAETKRVVRELARELRQFEDESDK